MFRQPWIHDFTLTTMKKVSRKLKTPAKTVVSDSSPLLFLSLLRLFPKEKKLLRAISSLALVVIQISPPLNLTTNPLLEVTFLLLSIILRMQFLLMIRLLLSSATRIPTILSLTECATRLQALKFIVIKRGCNVTTPFRPSCWKFSLVTSPLPRRWKLPLYTLSTPDFSVTS